MPVSAVNGLAHDNSMMSYVVHHHVGHRIGHLLSALRRTAPSSCRLYPALSWEWCLAAAASRLQQHGSAQVYHLTVCAVKQNCACVPGLAIDHAALSTDHGRSMPGKLLNCCTELNRPPAASMRRSPKHGRGPAARSSARSLPLVSTHQRSRCRFSSGFCSWQHSCYAYGYERTRLHGSRPSAPGQCAPGHMVHL
jgi:hypothetical protein